MIILLAIACSTNAILIEDRPADVAGEGWVDDVPLGTDADDPDPIDLAAYDRAEFRIVSPAAGDLISLSEQVHFQVELIGEDGQTLPLPDVWWSSDIDPSWDAIGNDFETRIGIGVHSITASVDLPNGDQVTHTIGGLRVQHALAGTFAGLFSASGGYQALSFTCSGFSNLKIDAEGEIALGYGNCLASLVVFDLPMDFEFDLDVGPAGELTGNAGIVIFAPFTYDFPVTGVVTPDRMSFAWGGGVIGGNFDVDATLTADRVSDEPLP